MAPPRKVRKHLLTRYTVKNGISNLYILLKRVLKMQEMPFQRPKFEKNFGRACPRTPLQLCRYYGLRLTKILATPLSNTLAHLSGYTTAVYTFIPIMLYHDLY